MFRLKTCPIVCFVQLTGGFNRTMFRLRRIRIERRRGKPKNPLLDTSRFNSYLLDSFVRFAGILPMDYPTEPDDGRFRFDLRHEGEGI
jgi:hypothetical protein